MLPLLSRPVCSSKTTGIGRDRRALLLHKLGHCYHCPKQRCLLNPQVLCLSSELGSKSSSPERLPFLYHSKSAFPSIQACPIPATHLTSYAHSTFSSTQSRRCSYSAIMLHLTWNAYSHIRPSPSIEQVLNKHLVGELNTNHCFSAIWHHTKVHSFPLQKQLDIYSIRHKNSQEEGNRRHPLSDALAIKAT